MDWCKSNLGEIIAEAFTGVQTILPALQLEGPYLSPAKELIRSEESYDLNGWSFQPTNRFNLLKINDLNDNLVLRVFHLKRGVDCVRFLSVHAGGDQFLRFKLSHSLRRTTTENPN